MELSIINLLWVMIPTFLAAFLHSLTGFGFSIVIMMFLPLVFSIGQSAAFAHCLLFVIALSILYNYRKSVNLKLLLLPLIFYFPIFFVALTFALRVQADFLKPALGITFLGIAVFYIFLSDRFTLHANVPTALICTALNAIVDAFFGIGGPFIAIYLLAITKTKEEYLSTLQAYFMISATYSVIMRIIKQQITPSMIPLIVAGVFALLIGFYLGNKVVNRIDGQTMKKIVYVFIGVVGVITFISSLPMLFAVIL
ncbi:sulfite exporter TauE/SafE family protein [Dehalobacterium formicoaceticum]|uniref:sulfite exporter TauE/SafE family protein n=1 Tax=Dehalobacterium formicoaceticum TaxID=51515 RepID=UPI000B7E52D2|nr:sulfite exporter TauE/SafE family protein [Dehalobacterium formicoaceticum]